MSSELLREQLQDTLGEGYRLERELGGGGMSRVFVATETALGRRVVVKVLPPDVAAAVSVERFRREIQLAARLQHPHIVPLLSAGESGAFLYYTMPFVDGESLRDLLRRDGAIPIGQAVRIVRDVADALAYAHECGIAHRDVKPDNVLLSRGHALVADFGVAKALSVAATSPASVTATSVTVGTPLYMAPEQIAADPQTDHRADIYALGVVAYELLAGRPPFGGESPQALFAAHMTQAPSSLGSHRPGLPVTLERLIMRCLEKRPADRPQSAEDVRKELEALTTSGEMGRYAESARRIARVARYAGLPAALLVGVVGYALVARRPEGRANAVAPTAAKSIAVLPFANLSPDRENEYFADGMTDELINALAKVPGLRVAARSSAFSFKGKRVDVRDAARRLNVTSVVEGSVRRAGDRLRVSAQLVDAHSGQTLWSEVYQRQAEDVFAVQEEIARAVVEKIHTTTDAPAAAAVRRRPTRDLAAYDAYLRGLYFSNQRTCDGFDKAVEAYREAVRRDTGFALAHAELAKAYYHLAMPCNHPPRQVMPKARATALKALALDSTLGEARVALASVWMMFDWNWPDAERELRRAIELSPGYIEGRRQLAYWLVTTRRRAQGIAEAERFLSVDPLDYVSNVDFGIILFYAREYDRLIEHARSMLKRNPDDIWGHQSLGLAYAARGERDNAVAAFRRGGSTGNARLYSGHRDSVLKEIAQRKDRAQRREGSAYALAIAYAQSGMIDEAFEWLEKAYEQREAWMMWMTVDPRVDPLRSDARFAKLLQRVGVDSSPTRSPGR